MRFVLVSETSVPEETGRLLREACEFRRIDFETVIAKTFDFDPALRLSPGDLLYNAATSLAALRAEQFLYGPGVATFHSEPDGICFSAGNQALMAAAAGIPTPRTVYLASGNSSLLEAQVERVGGFPVVLKVLGRSSGVGIMLAESMRSLRPLVDFTLAQGQNPLLSEFIPNALHWRVVVLGGQAIAWYRNPIIDGDFRSRGGRDRADFETRPPDTVLETALRAVPLFRVDFAGVDVLEDNAGRAWFLEANFPCYFPHAQVHGGIDIAGKMVDFLAAKAGHLPRAYEIRRLASEPAIFVVNDFLSAGDCEYVLAKGDSVDRDSPEGIHITRSSAGFAFEMQIGGDERLKAIRDRIARITGIPNDLGFSFRFRRYAEGESHRPHLDRYEAEGRNLVATALVYLTDTECGGETHFPQALPAPVSVAPKRGRLAIWLNHRADGSVDEAALHSSLPVSRGTKATIGNFIYKPIGEFLALRAASPLMRAELRIPVHESTRLEGA